MTHYLIVSVAPDIDRAACEVLSAVLRDRMPGVEPVIVAGVDSVHLVSVPPEPQPTQINFTVAGRMIEDPYKTAEVMREALRRKREGEQ